MIVREVWIDAKTGESGVRWVEIPVLTEAEAAQQDALVREAEARAERNARLLACDWTTNTDVPMSDERRAAWVAYRQALRDLPQLAGFPDVDWPVPPDA